MILLLLLFCELQLPPLPEPLAVEIKPIQPEKMFIPLDSLSVSSYLLNPYGGFFRLSKGVENYLFNIDMGINGGKDYASYSQTHFEIGGGNISSKKWLGAYGNYKRNSRGDQAWQHLQFSTSPLFYFSHGDLYFDSEIRWTEFNTHHFIGIFYGQVWEFANHPNLWTLRSNLIYQRVCKSGKDYLLLPLSLSFKISSPFLFLRPEFLYEPFHARSSFDTYLILSKFPFLFNFRFILNRESFLLFDTLYAPVSFFEVNEDIEFPIHRIGFEAELKIWSFSIAFSRMNISSFLFWDDIDRDSLLEPHNLSTTKEEMGLSYNLKISWLENHFSIFYKKFSPLPSMVADVNVLDSLILKRAGLFLGISYKYTGRRDIQDNSMDPYSVLSIFSGYKRGVIYVYLKVNNLLGKEYEPLPYRFDKGQKYCLGVELAKNI